MHKILLVEDDPYIRDITATRLMEHDFLVTSAATGEDALLRMHESTPDLILLDLDLPHMHGLDVLNEMRKDMVLAEITTVVFTNNDDREVHEKVLAAGAKEIFNKAMTEFDDMLSVIQRYLD